MSTAPTTDCPFCGRTAKLCGDEKARGWGNCCLRCEAAGHVEAHRVRAISVGQEGE